MDPLIGGSLISAGSSLLGGLFGGKSKNVSAADNIISLARGVRLASEEQGFNPLTLLGASGGMGGYSYQAGNPAMGQALADAGLLLAEGMEKRQEKIALEAEKKKNEELQRKVTNLTIRPKVGGIYAQTETTPTLLGALGRGSDASANSARLAPDGSGYLRGDPSLSGYRPLEPLRASESADYRREVDHKPVSTTAGWMGVDNPTLGRMWVPTLDGDEALDVSQYPTYLYAWSTRERGLGSRLIDLARTGDFYGSMHNPHTQDFQKNRDFLSGYWKNATSAKPKSKPKKKSQHPLKGLGF